jgi:uncharacterized protein
VIDNFLISQIMQSFDLMFSVSGFFVGVLVGLTGVGGGSLMTPILVLFFGVSPTTAVGTDLIYAAITKSFGTIIHNKRKSVDWKIVFFLAIGSVPATIATLLAIQTFGQTPKFVLMLKHFLAYALFATALMVMARGYIVNFSRSHYDGEHVTRNTFLTIVVGAIIGVLVSLTSVGAGALGVTALILLYPKFSTLRIVASDIAHAVPLTLFAGAGYFFLGQVDIGMLLALLLGSVPGILIGSHFAPKVPEKILRTILSIVLSLVAFKLLNSK